MNGSTETMTIEEIIKQLRENAEIGDEFMDWRKEMSAIADELESASH